MSERHEGSEVRASVGDEGAVGAAQAEQVVTNEIAAAPAAEAPRKDARATSEEALPDRYDLDEIVAIAVDPGAVYLYWEVRAKSLARARAKRPDGGLAVRVAAVTASWDGPLVDTRDLDVDALYGDRFVRGLRPGSNVRVTVGWRTEDAFEPFAVGAEVTTPRVTPSDAAAFETGRWQPAPTGARAAEGYRPSLASPVAGVPPDARRAQVSSAADADTDAFAKAIGARRPFALPADSDLRWSGSTVGSSAADRGPREEQIEEPWFIAGGASDLARGGPGRSAIVGPGAFGGASDLVRGGASELSRGPG